MNKLNSQSCENLTNYSICMFQTLVASVTSSFESFTKHCNGMVTSVIPCKFKSLILNVWITEMCSNGIIIGNRN